jgi:hypothetical protein
MQGACVTPRGGSGFLVNNARPHTLLRQQQGGQHAHRAGSHHQDFGLGVVRQNLFDEQAALSATEADEPRVGKSFAKPLQPRIVAAPSK